jgi:hypothetical protein
MSLPSLVLAADMLSPTMALETPPMVVAMLHHDRKVRSLAAGRQVLIDGDGGCWEGQLQVFQQQQQHCGEGMQAERVHWDM